MSKVKRKQMNIDFNIMEQIQPSAAGIDIGAEEIYVCIPADRDDERIRVFPTFTSDLKALANWLVACRVESVAMGSTSIFWIPVRATYSIRQEFKQITISD